MDYVEMSAVESTNRRAFPPVLAALLCVFCTVCLLVSAPTWMGSIAQSYAQERAVVTSGACGSNVTWTFYDDGELAISGSGDMANYLPSTVPWADYRGDAQGNDQQIVIKKVTIGKGITYIGENTFSNCPYLEQVEFESNSQIETIGNAAFSCSAIKAFDIPSSVTSLGNSVFSGCASLGAMTIPVSVASMGKAVFKDCTLLESVVFADGCGLTAIGANVFQNCEKLALVDFRGKSYIESIDATAFNTAGLFKVDGGAEARVSTRFAYSWFAKNYPKATLTVVPTATQGDHKLKYLYDNACTEAWIFGIDDADEELTDAQRSFLSISANVGSGDGSVPVVGIMEKAFKDVTSLRQVVLPEGLVTIEASAFEGCISMTEIAIPSTVKTIDDNAFRGCALLGEAILKEGSLEAIGNGTFAACPKLTSLEIPQSVSAIGKAAFDPMENVSFPNGSSIETVEGGMFQGCANVVLGEGTTAIGAGGFSSALKSVALPSSMTLIGDKAFSGCSKLESVDVPKAVTAIRSSAFSGCSKLGSVLFADDAQLAIIGASAFSGCSALESIGVPAAVTSIGASAFSGCSKLGAVSFSPSAQLASLGTSAFQGCVALSAFTIPETVRELGDSAFSGCKSLTEMRIPAGLPSIGTKAFYNCSALTNLSFGEGSALASIGVSAFQGCKALRGLEAPASVTSIGANAFNGCAALTSISFGENSLLATLGEQAFYGCSALGNVSFGEGSLLSTIEKQTFANCTALTTITLPSKVSAIGVNSFANCSSLEFVDLKTTWAELKSGCFMGLANPSLISVASEAMLEQLDGNDAFLNTQDTMVIYNDGTKRNIGGAEITIVNGDAIQYDPEGVTPELKVTYGGEDLTVDDYEMVRCDVEAASGTGEVLIRGKGAYYGFKRQSFAVQPVVVQIPTATENLVYNGQIQTGVQVPGNAVYTCTDNTNTAAGSYEAKLSLKDKVNYRWSDGTKDDKLVEWRIAPKQASVLPDNVFAVYGENPALTASVAGMVEGEDAAKLIKYTLTRAEGEDVGEYEVTATGEELQGNYAVSFGTAKLTIQRRDITPPNSESNPITLKPTSATYTGQPIEPDVTVKVSGKTLVRDTDYTLAFTDNVEPGMANVRVVGIGNYAGQAEKTFAIELPHGTCGDGLTWTLQPNGELVISGGGAMSNYRNASAVPWKDYRGGASTIPITKVTISAGVATIGNYAFSGCTALEEVTFEEGTQLKTIGASSFAGCTALEEFTVPASVSTIGASAFQNCSSLENLVVQDGSQLESIGSKAFYGAGLKVVHVSTKYAYEWFAKNCPEAELDTPSTIIEDGGQKHQLVFVYGDDGKAWVAGFGASVPQSDGAVEQRSYITLPASFDSKPVVGILDGAFAGVTSLRKVVLSEGIETVGASAFAGCSSLTEVEIPRTMKTIGTSAYNGCKLLETVNFNGAALQLIGDSAFSGCVSLVDVAFSATSIGKSAFSGCTALENVEFEGELLESIGESAFSGCTALGTVVFEKESLQSIGASAFNGCTSLVSLNIPKSVSNIGKAAFNKVDSISFPNGSSVTTVNGGMFQGCPHVSLGEGTTTIGAGGFNATLQSVVLPKSVTAIGDSAFLNCSGLQTVTFPADSQLATIGASAFKGCKALSGFAIPICVTGLGASAFEGCVKLEDMLIPAGVPSIAARVFYGCTNLGTLTFTNGTQLASIGASAFQDCGSLSVFAVPATVTEIGDSAFKGCASLTGMAIPKAVIGLGDSAFFGCTKLESISFPADSELKSIGSMAFQKCSALQRISVPVVTTSIGAHAFDSCVALTNVSFAEGSLLETLGDNSFKGCTALRTIRIPLTSQDKSAIGEKAFAGCSSLEMVYLDGEWADLGDDCFKNIANPSLVCVTSEGMFNQLNGNPNFIDSETTDVYSKDGNRHDIEDAVITIANADDIQYSTDDVTPKFSVTYGDAQLEEGTEGTERDFVVVRYENNTKAGNAHVLIRGTGSYYGFKRQAFTIKPATVQIPDTAGYLTYNGSDQSYFQLPDNPVYTCTGNTAKKAGTYQAKLVLKDKANYRWSDMTTDDKTADWSIAKKHVSVQPDDKIIEYLEKNPTLTATVTGLVEGDATSLVKYTLTRERGSDVGVYDIVASGNESQGNYQVSFGTGVFTIQSKDITPANLGVNPITLKPTSSTYTGEPIEPTVTVKVAGKTLVRDTDYTLTFSNNREAGEAKVLVEGVGNYTGLADATFTIKKAGGAFTAQAKTSKQTVTYHESEPTVLLAADLYEIDNARGAVSFEKRSGNDGIAVSAETGDITVAAGLKAGSYKVVVSVADAGDSQYESVTKSITFTVVVAKAESSIALDDQTVTYTGSALPYSGKVAVGGSTGKVTYKYYSDEDCKTTVSLSNVKNPGVYYVRGTVAADANYDTATSEPATYTILPKGTSLKTVTSAKGGFVAEWSEQSAQTSGYMLRYATDSSFEKGVETVVVESNMTTSTVVAGLKAKTKYYVEVCTYKTINGNDLRSPWSDAIAVTTEDTALHPSSIKLTNQVKSFTGTKVKYTGKTKVEGSTGKVAYKYYSDNKCTKPIAAKNVKNPGVYYVRGTVASDGAYAAATSKVAKLTVRPKGTTIKAVKALKVAKGAKKGGFTVTWKKQAKQTTGYQLRYGTNAKLTKNAKSINVKKTKTVSTKVSGLKLKAKTKYYVKIRTYKVVKGKKMYSAWSKAKTVVLPVK